MAISRITSPKAPGWVIMPSSSRRCASRQANDQERRARSRACPATSGTRRSPARRTAASSPSQIEMRESLRRMRSPTKLRQVLEHRRADAGHHQQDQQAAQRLADLEKTIARAGRRRRCSVSHRPCVRLFEEDRQKRARARPTLSLAKKTVKIRIATKEARIAASFECGSLPFLDGVADLLLGRFFGLAVLVGGFGHALMLVEVTSGGVLAASAWTAVRTRPRRQA